MKSHVRWRHVVAVAALVCLAAPSGIAQSTVPSSGPTRIKIAAGTVSAEETRAGLLGVWEPDADLGPGLPPGSNQTIYLADGLYINPFQKVALIAFWSATANVLTSTPFEMRQLATGASAPGLKETFQVIGWDKPTVTPITWLTPDRYQEGSRQGAQQRAFRRAQRVHDVTTVHRATVMDLLPGSWIKPDGTTVIFEPDGTFREQVSSRLSTAIGRDPGTRTAARGTYEFDAVAGLLRRTNSAVDNAASFAALKLRTGPQAPSRLRWTSRDSVTIDDAPWTRESKTPAPSAPPSTRQTPPAPTGGRGFLGVGTPTTGVPILTILQNSPAASLGLRPGDVIARLDGTAVQNASALHAALASRKPGDRVEIEFSREGGPRSSLTATLTTGPNGEGSLGVGLSFVGAFVSQVRADSPAERVGLQVGDWIVAVNGGVIQDGEDLAKTVQSLAPGTAAVIRVIRSGRMIDHKLTIASLPQ